MQPHGSQVVATGRVPAKRLYRERWYRKRIWALDLSSRLVALLTVAFACFAAEACSIATRAADPETSASLALAFENSSIDPVTVYLDRAGSRLLLGHVEPGRKARLRIPEFASLRTRSDLRVVVVPLGADRDGSRVGNTVNAVCSDLESAQQIVAMQWLLRGQTLVSVAPPRDRR